MDGVHYIHVDSKNRDSNLYPYGNSYVLHLVSTIKNVKSVDLVTARIPNSMYNLTDGSNVITTDSVTISLNSGFYSALLLESELNTRINVREKIKYLQDEGKFIYLTNGSTNTIKFNTVEISTMMGFQKDVVYTVQQLSIPIEGFAYGVKSINVIDLSLNDYVFLDIEEFRTPFFEDARAINSKMNIRNIFTAIPMDVPSTCVKTFKENTDFKTGINVPMKTIDRLTINWYDKNSKLINFQGFENNSFILRVNCHTETSQPEKDTSRDDIDMYIQEVKKRIFEETEKKPQKKTSLGKWFVLLVILALIGGIYIYR